jgi:hypothetical protein
MTDPLAHRLKLALAAGVAVSALGAAPALATEPGTKPVPLPGGISPITITPLPSQPVPVKAQRVIRRARVVPRRVARSRRAMLKISLSTPSRLQIVMRSPSGHRLRVFDLPAGNRAIRLRLPRRAHGQALRPGRYLIRIVAIDANGVRSQPVVRTLIVRRGR